MTDPHPFPSTALSDTEVEILRLVATGATNREIGRARHISEATVKKHLTNINLKLGTGNRTEAMRRALELGLVSVDTPVDRDASAADGARSAHDDVARRLAEELERARQRSRHTGRGLVVASGLVLLLGFALTYVLVREPAGVAPRPVAAPTAVVAAGQPFWIPAAPLSGGPRSGLALATVGNTVYAIGGEGPSGVRGDTLRYERGLVNQWKPEPAKPTAARDIAAAVVEERIVVPGGCGADGRALDVVEVYDPATRTWAGAPSLPEPRCGYGLAVLDGRIYLFGGRASDDPGTAADDIWTFRLGDAAWVPVADVDRMPQPRADLAVAVVERAIHVLGGRDPSGEAWPDHWIFRPFAPSKWDTSSGVRLPQARAGHVATGLVQAGSPQARRWIYVVGGGWNANVQPGAILLELDGDAGWRPFADLGNVTAGQTPQRGAGLTVRNAGGQLFLGGGQTADGEPLDRTHILNLGSENMPAPGG